MKPLFLLVGVGLTGLAHAQETTIDFSRGARGFGIGIAVGEPSGLSFAARPNSWSAVQGHASWSLIHDRARFGLGYNQSLAVLRAEGAPGIDFPLYVGVGGDVAVWNEGAALGVRVPFGVAMLPSTVPVDVFAEVGPTVWLTPETEIDINGVIGVRAWF